MLATTWKEKRAELSKLQKQRGFTDARDLKRSFRVEIEEMKKRTKCHRCGRTGHWFRECRQKRDFSGKGAASSKGSSSGKGTATETGAAAVAATVSSEPYFVASVSTCNPTLLEKLRMSQLTSARDLIDEYVADEVLLVSSPGYGVLDSGCGKTIIGEDTLSNFQELWQHAGIKTPVEKTEINQFRFGNGQVETSSRLIDLPVGLAGKSGILQAAVVKGIAPLLVSRPALKRLGATIDFADDRLKLFHGRLELPLKVNSAGQYMVDVMQFASPVSDASAEPMPMPDQVPEHSALPVTHEHVPNNVEPHDDNPPHDNSNNQPCDDSPLPLEQPHESLLTAQQNIAPSTKQGGISKKQLRQWKAQVKRNPRPLGQKYAVVEVFSPPRVVPQVEKMGLKGLSVDIKQGWNLMDPQTRAWLKTELWNYPPELLILCPPCTDAGGWFHLNKWYMSMQEFLRRKHMLRVFKKFCKELIAQQIALGGRFVFEHPIGSEVWQDPEMVELCNELCPFKTDMCCFDLHLPATENHPKKLVKKSTRLLVSNHDMKPYLQRLCPGDSKSSHAHHATIAGSDESVGKVSVHAGKYTPAFVQALLKSVPALRSEEVLCIDEIPKSTLVPEVLVAENAELGGKSEDVSDDALEKVLKRLHNNLGHPSTPEFIRVLKHGQASERALTLAAKFKCPVCESMKGPAIANPANVSHVSVFNHKIGIDVKLLPGWQMNQKIKALNVIDYASNFQIMAPFFDTETASLLRQLLNDRWLSWAGPPCEIVMDPARTNLGKALTEPCELEGTHVSVIAAGAHWQLGKTEVHGGIFAKVLSKVIAERNPTSKAEWLDCVRHCHVKNSTIQTHGFTPSQVVFGKNPDLPGELLTEPQNALLEDNVEKAQSIRHSAKKAILELQDDKSMRRALAARPRLARNFRAGDIVAYWRDQKWQQGKLSRGGRWYGSAVAIGLIGKNVVIAHRTHILRCAPEQLRLATPEEKQLIETPETQLLGVKDMLEGGTFRSAQYLDLLHEAYPPVEGAVMENVVSSNIESPSSDVNMPPAVEPTVEAVPPTSAERVSVPVEGVFDDDVPTETKPIPKSAQGSRQPVDAAVVPPDAVELSAEPSSSNSASSSAPIVDKSSASTYGPMRRVPTKTGPMSLHRPMPTSHADFVEVLTEVLPNMLDQAVDSVKRSAPEASEEPQSKIPRRTDEQLSVESPACDDGSLSHADAQELWNSLQSGTTHEVLFAQYLQKRMQKELRHSNNEPWLQGQIDAAKTAEWNTLTEKQAVRLLSPAEADRVRKRFPNRIMGSRFVLTRKAQEDIVENGLTPNPNNHEHWKVKARWCLQGHLDPDLSSKAQAGQLQSPTLSQMGRMVLFQLLSGNRWMLQLGDIKGAFLEAGPLDPKYRPLYAWLPAGGIPGASSDQLVEVLGNVKSAKLAL